MIKSLFTLALRNLTRYKVYSAINLFGLIFGLSCCLLIFIYIHHELSYDDFHIHGNDIYRLVEDVSLPSGSKVANATSTGAAGLRLAEEFPEIESVVRVIGASVLVSSGEKRFQEERVYFADSTLFKVFTFPLEKGDERNALLEPRSAVLTEETARKYFGSDDPLGKTVIIDDDIPFTVTGVTAPVPFTSHLQFDMVLSMSTRNASWLEGWSWSAYTYLRISPGTEVANLQGKFPGFVSRHTGSGMWTADVSHELSLQPLNEVHHSTRTGEPGTPGNLFALYLFSAIAFFIMLIACINFVNLSVAQSVRRSREVGLRKVIGGTRFQLVLQFLAESVFLTLIATFFAIGVSELLLPVLQRLAGAPVSFEAVATPKMISAFFFAAVVIGLVAGSYPAFVMSGGPIAGALKGVYHHGLGAGGLRKALIVIQFSVSMILITGTIIIFSQLQFLRQQDSGYDHQQQIITLYFGDDTKVQDQNEGIKSELRRIPGVKRITASSHVPGTNPLVLKVTTEKSNTVPVQTVEMRVLSVDEEYTDFYGLNIIAGKGFSLQRDRALNEIIINETALNRFGAEQTVDFVGKTLVVNGQPMVVVGVVKDFHYRSLHHQIEPLAMRLRSRSLSFFSIETNISDVSSVLRHLEARWKTLAPHRPFDVTLLDDRLHRLYQADSRFAILFGIFAIVAILLACLGLLGLTSFSVQQRRREIGVRKVFGASVLKIITVLSHDYIVLVVIAVLVATPLTWYGMHRWLFGFAYRIELQAWMFIAAGISVFATALITVGIQSARAARANPIDALRHD